MKNIGRCQSSGLEKVANLDYDGNIHAITTQRSEPTHEYKSPFHLGIS